MYYAHSGTTGDKSDWQTLTDHLNETAGLAAAFAAPFGLERLAFRGRLRDGAESYAKALATYIRR